MVTRGFDAFDSKEPPLGIPMSARNNIDGVSYLYLTEDEYTACSEIRPSPNSCISLASFELMRDINVIDFTNSQKSVIDFLYLHDTLDITPAIMMTRIMSKFSEYKEDETVYGRAALYYHTGSGYGVYNCISYDPTSGDGVVVLSTGASGAKDKNGIYAVCGEIMNCIYGITQRTD